MDKEGEEGGGADEEVPAPANKPGEEAKLIPKNYATFLERVVSGGSTEGVLTSTMLAEARATTSSWSSLGT